MYYKVNITAENNSGVLYRIANILLKRKINIFRLNAYPLKKEQFKILKITFLANIDEKKIETISKLINKIIEVEKVSYKKANFSL